MATRSVVLSAVNNSPAVSRGYSGPTFTMRVKDMNTAGKALCMESSQFELHFENVSPETNKLYVVERVRVITGEVVRMSGEAIETTEAVQTPEAFKARETMDIPGKAPILSGFTVGMPGRAVETREAVEMR